MKERFNFMALKGYETDGDFTINGSFLAKGKVSCRVLKVEGDFVLDGGMLVCQELHVNGNAYIRGNVYMNSEGADVPTSCKVHVGGDFICEGMIAAHGGEVTIDGCFITTSMVRLGYSRVKVMEDISVQYLECGEICVGGNIHIEWGMLDAKGRIYALGDICSFELTSNYNNIYCGGRCTANRYSVGKVFEYVKDWEKIN